MDYYYYTVMLTDVSAEDARKMDVHLTFGQEWREHVIAAIEEGGVTMVAFKSFADLFELYPGMEFAACVGEDGSGRSEIDLYVALKEVS